MDAFTCGVMEYSTRICTHTKYCGSWMRYASGVFSLWGMAEMNWNATSILCSIEWVWKYSGPTPAHVFIPITTHNKFAKSRAKSKYWRTLSSSHSIQNITIENYVYIIRNWSVLFDKRMDEMTAIIDWLKTFDFCVCSIRCVSCLTNCLRNLLQGYFCIVERICFLRVLCVCSWVCVCICFISFHFIFSTTHLVTLCYCRSH